MPHRRRWHQDRCRTGQRVPALGDHARPESARHERLADIGNGKDDPATRHIPVHIMSVEEEVLDAYHKGAMGYLTKPVSQEKLEGIFTRIEKFISKEIKSLLLVEDDKNARRSILKLLGGSDVQITKRFKVRWRWS